ncbi:MAG TPA: thioredoxin [Candidatus Hydrogenedentes bacterium]|jgi:thioredoxin 1|nr:thioredoxin [Candidatus Hydrogenedentota bacterium]MDY0034110.1 thioredoxin [FCB group bacterium]NLT62166.1 thioredoxin [Candidatus Hydrogenedentota bacterium]HNV22407.1 thioredoxin [Candidatus Hydrogenedentota bacterium]HNZ20154.1 thioredoxin [Candidatus Hydrogenedentota bacterium]
MGNARELTKDDFDSVIGSGVTLVDFWAEWCGPCRMMTPAIEELAAQYAGKATIAKVNVDNENDLAAKFNVSSIPTLLVFKDGKVAHQFVGVTPKAELAKAIDGALG